MTVTVDAAGMRVSWKLEGVQATDVVAPGALGAGPGVGVVGSEIGEGGLLVGQQVPDDDQDGLADRDDGFLLAPAPASRR